ncbi:hypothetical protein [Alteromonas stellipolaris]|uniref:hypothetical protein n=1 Tax=Alteromonas stellipolaris TaxID=233316 RepID=UPI001D5BC246|nr:hypothetical protein [Alteromonas stellipolaris]MBZ2162381.1 hypothetical protein [Alteromonas stellipolaris]
MSNGINASHGKTIAELVIPSKTWSLHPEKKPAFTTVDEAIDYFDDNNEPLYIKVPFGEDDDVLVHVNSSGEDVVFTISDLNHGGESRVDASHLKNLSSSVVELIEQCYDGKKSPETM